MAFTAHISKLRKRNFARIEEAEISFGLVKGQVFIYTPQHPIALDPEAVRRMFTLLERDAAQ